jgi:hypothetical protein
MRWIVAGCFVALVGLRSGIVLADEPTWELVKDTLKLDLKGESSVVIDTHGKYAAVPVLRIKLTAGGSELEPLFLGRAKDEKEYNRKGDAFFQERLPGEKNKYKIRFKSKAMNDAIKQAVGAKGGTVTAEVQEVWANNVGDKWEVKGVLTNSQKKSLEVPGK